MKKNAITILAITFGLMMFIWSGCEKDNGPDTEEFIIQIDSIVHVDTINFGHELSIKFYGTVGPDGCYAFDGLLPEYEQISETSGELAITAMGIHTIQDVCTQAIVYMNGNELLVSDIPAGNLIIKAMQPDGSSITQNVYIKE